MNFQVHPMLENHCCWRVDFIIDELNGWLIPTMFKENLKLSYDKNQIIPLSIGKENYWNEIEHMINDDSLTHERSREYCSYIIDSIENNIN